MARTIEKMRKHVEKEMKEWVVRQRDFLRDSSFEELQDWVSGGTKINERRVSSCFDFISTWSFGAYAESGFRGMPDKSLLALSTRCAMSGFLCEIPLYVFHPKNPSRFSFDTYGLMLAQAITTGWKDHSELIARHGFSELNRLLKGGDSYGRVPWFMLNLSKDWLKAEVNFDNEFRASQFEDLGVWDKVLAGWRSKNDQAFDALMSEAADHHLSQSQYMEDEEEYFEFEPPPYWLFPVELLAVLRLREWEGIPNPPLSHPIFTVTPLAKLYPAPDWPSDPVLDAAEAKFRGLYPDTPSVADLPALRKTQGGA